MKNLRYSDTQFFSRLLFYIRVWSKIFFLWHPVLKLAVCSPFTVKPVTLRLSYTYPREETSE